MPEKIRVEYSRKLSTQSNGEYHTDQFGAGWEFEVDDGADFQTEYGNALAVVKTTVDQLFDGDRVIGKIEQPVEHERLQPEPPRELPGERFQRAPERPADAPPARPTNGAIVEGQMYEFQNARVWAVDSGRTPRGKEFAKVRIGSKGQIPGTGYASVKSFNPHMISKLKGLREGDHIDIRGEYEGWDGRDGRMYDFVPSDIERVRDVRAD